MAVELVVNFWRKAILTAMTEYLEFEINGTTVSLCFTRMSEEDNWHCFMSDETLKDLQMIVHKNF